MDKIYILLNGEVQTYLTLPDQKLILDTLNEPGCVFGEASFLNTKEAVNYNLKCSKQARLLIIKRNLVRDMCQKYPEVDLEYKLAAEKVEYRGFPLLDYRKCYKRYDEDYKPVKLDTRRILSNCFEKMCKVINYKRGRGFHFADLIKFMKRNMMSEDSQRKEKAIEMLDMINDVLKEKTFTTLCDPIDRMFVCQERSNFKIGKITNLLHRIKFAKERRYDDSVSNSSYDDETGKQESYR